MSQDFTYTIDRYLKGHLSEEELQAFREEMQQDPLLAHEVKWQKDIYRALGDARRAALKSRLDKVTVPTSPYAVGTWWLTAAAVGVLLLAGSAYYYLTPETSTLGTLPHVEAPLTYSKAYTVQRIPQRSAPRVDAPRVDALGVDTPRAEAPATTSAPVPQSVSTSEVSGATPTKAPRTQPVVARPQVVSQFDDEAPVVDHSHFSAPTETALPASSYHEEEVTIEARADDRYSFHYQFFDHKLYLHGNFDQAPYKVIALNTKSSKKLFLEFGGSYYRISRTETVAPLVKIEDTVLIESLEAVGTLD
jgi:hypothetical protein